MSNSGAGRRRRPGRRTSLLRWERGSASVTRYREAVVGRQPPPRSVSALKRIPDPRRFGQWGYTATLTSGLDWDAPRL